MVSVLHSPGTLFPKSLFRNLSFYLKTSATCHRVLLERTAGLAKPFLMGQKK